MNKGLQRYLATLRHPLFFIGWFTLIILFAYNLDKPLAIYCHQQVQGQLMTIMQWLTQFGNAKWPLITTAVATLIALTRKNRHLAWIFGFLFLSMAVAGLTCDLFKIILSRARPSQLFSNQVYGLQWFEIHARFWSFPSGHTTTTAALMTAISLLYPRSWLFCMIVILLIASSRVMVGAHYLSDVMGGFYLGTVSTYYLKQYLERKYTFLQQGLLVSPQGSN